jgi:histidyl-tRNA synthetase
MLEAGGYTADQVVLDQTIARGLDYYTGIIYETSLKGAEELGSVCSGGRFDNLVEDMGGPNLPAVGTSIGVDRLYDGLQKLGILREAKTTTEVLVANFEEKNSPDYMRVATALRRAGIAAEIFYEDVKLGKQFRFADRMQIPYVVLMGPDEMEKESAIVKTLESGEQVEVPLHELSDSIKKLRKRD